MQLKNSRRRFLAGSIATSGMLLSVRASAANRATLSDPVIDLRGSNVWGGERIVEISVVVKDARSSAQRLADIFGMRWNLFEFTPRSVLLHDKVSPGPCRLKLAIGQFGGYSFKLVEPASGASAYGEFLEAHGSGFYSIGLGPLEVDLAISEAGAVRQSIIERFAKAGIGTSMQGEVGNGARFAILDTVRDLGCRIEFTTRPQVLGTGNFRQTGVLTPHSTSVIDMDNPAVGGGRRFDEIGIVVKDEKWAAERYQALLGLDHWTFWHGRPTSEILNGEPLSTQALAQAGIGGAYAYAGGACLELLAPSASEGSHGVFLKNHGPGIQMLRMNSAGNHDAEIAALLKAGMNLEREATFYPPSKISGPHFVASFLNMGGDLSGLVLEYFDEKST